MTNYERVWVGSMTNKLGLSLSMLSSSVDRALLKFFVDLVSLDLGKIGLLGLVL